MSAFYDAWPPYVPVAERRKQAARQVAKLAKKGQVMSPVKITGKGIANTFWGKAWCENLESYRDFENRLPRGRTYVRNGSVLDLQISPQEISALVSGSSLYKVKVQIKASPKAQWQAICRDCAGGIDSLVELLQGRFSQGVMARLCRQDNGLFPKPAEIQFSCSCPDYASLCKHIAAVLYGVGARLDERPELLFKLRAVDERELVANLAVGLPLAQSKPDAGRVLADDNLAELFGLDLAAADPPSAASRATQRVAKMPGSARKKATTRDAPQKPAPGKKALPVLLKRTLKSAPPAPPKAKRSVKSPKKKAKVKDS